jgi:hypothetical protein
VAKDMVLTAAHCIFPLPESGQVQIMREDLNSNDGEEINVTEFIIHPSYNDDTLAFDYALLVLESATTEDIKLIKLNSNPFFPAVGSVARIMGWGDTTHQGPSSNVTLEANVDVISNAECSELTDDVIKKHTICTLRKDKFVGGGDSGETTNFSVRSQALSNKGTKGHSPRSSFPEFCRWSTHHCWCITRQRCSDRHCIMGL